MAYEYFRAGQKVTAGALNDMGLVGQVVFKATRDAAQSISDTAAGNVDLAANAVDFDAVEIDELGGWSASTPSRYTAQRAGWYEVSGAVGFASNSTGSRTCAWGLNGSIVAGGHSQRISANSATTHNQVAPSMPIEMAVGDYVELGAGQSSGAALNLTTGGPRSFAAIKFVRPADA